MYRKLRSIKYEARKPQKNIRSVIRLIQGAHGFKEFNGHCDFNKAGCIMPTGYQDLPQSLQNEVVIKNLVSKLAKQKFQVVDDHR